MYPNGVELVITMPVSAQALEYVSVNFTGPVIHHIVTDGPRFPRRAHLRASIHYPEYDLQDSLEENRENCTGRSPGRLGSEDDPGGGREESKDFDSVLSYSS